VTASSVFHSFLPYLEAVSAVYNLRTCNAMVAGTHIIKGKVAPGFNQAACHEDVLLLK
jgi:hypothetical protein